MGKTEQNYSLAVYSYRNVVVIPSAFYNSSNPAFCIYSEVRAPSIRSGNIWNQGKEVNVLDILFFSLLYSKYFLYNAWTFLLLHPIDQECDF